MRQGALWTNNGDGMGYSADTALPMLLPPNDGLGPGRGGIQRPCIIHPSSPRQAHCHEIAASLCGPRGRLWGRTGRIFLSCRKARICPKVPMKSPLIPANSLH